MHAQAERKFMKEIDVVNILDTVQKTKLLFETGFTERQKVLAHFQYRNLIQSEDQTESSDDYTKLLKDKKNVEFE